MIRKKRRTGEKIIRLDSNLWMTLIFICCFGAIMVYSASSYDCSINQDYNYDSMYLFKRQVAFMALGFVSIFIFQFANYNLIKKLAYFVYCAGIGCIFLLLTPLGVSANGAYRWINLGFTQFQVAEIVKIAVIVILAYLIDQYYNKLNSVRLTVYLWLAGGIPASLLFLISNDLSSAIVVLSITYATSFICTKTTKLHLYAAAVVLLLAAAYVMSIAMNLPEPDKLGELPFRVGRIAAWIDPERYASDQGYQVLQGLYAIGSGGFWGKGLGNSIQKIGVIPESQNDMIFSIICEELGVPGALMVIGLLTYLLYLIYEVASSAENIFGTVLAIGVLFHIASQSLINLFVNVNWFPNTGIPLPFFSYGGTSVFCLLAEMAIIMSIERRRALKK